MLPLYEQTFFFLAAHYDFSLVMAKAYWQSENRFHLNLMLSFYQHVSCILYLAWCEQLSNDRGRKGDGA